MTSRFSRREFIKFTMVAGATIPAIDTSRLAFASAAPCRLTPEQEVGPYWLDGDLVRRDIREDKAGVPLTLDIVLIDAKTCAPLAGAAVDIWQCDALGTYSGYTQMKSMPPPDFNAMPPGPPPGGMPPGPPPAPKPTDHLTFLRGIQRTDRAGTVTFDTIVPGNYPGRTNHIHFKVRTANASHAEGSHVSHVGQIFFPESLSTQLAQIDPYRANTIRRTTLSEDPVYVHQSGATMLASVKLISNDDPAKGLYARVEAVVNPDAEPRPIEPMPGPPPR
jgi:protocatechuate 3,4-dioxygenase beta subunit